MSDCGGWRREGGAEVRLRGSIRLVVCMTGVGSVEGVRPIGLLVCGRSPKLCLHESRNGGFLCTVHREMLLAQG